MPKDNNKKVLNCPPLRFPEFTGEWEANSLKSVCKIDKGAGISKAELSETGEPCILYGELYTKYKSEIINEIVSKTNIPSDKLVRSRANDVIIPCSGETAIDIATARCIPYDNILLGGDLNILRLSKKVDGAFLSYQLNGTRRKDIAKVAQGVSVVHLYPEHIKGIKVYIPTAHEQKKIAKLISLLDERIATQNKIIEKLQSLIRGINDDFHNSLKGESVSFNMLGEAYSGLSGKSGEDFGCGKPYITYLNVYQNNVVLEEQVEYVKVGENERQNKVRNGDILFTLSSETPDEVGVGAVFLGMDSKYYLNSFCFGIHITSTEKVYPPYMAYFVSSKMFRRFVLPLAQGSTRFNLQKNDFMRKNFCLPNFDQQVTIAKYLDCITEKLNTESALKTKYEVLKQHLLSQMFI